MTHAPRAQAVVKLRDRMLLMTSLDSCSCQTHECQCLATCQHLPSTLSRDSSNAKYVYESNHHFRQDSWNSIEPLAELQSSQLLGTQLIQSAQEEQPFGSVSSALWQSTTTTTTGKSASPHLDKPNDRFTPQFQISQQSFIGLEKPTQHRIEQDARAIWAQDQPLEYLASSPVMMSRFQSRKEKEWSRPYTSYWSDDCWDYDDHPWHWSDYYKQQKEEKGVWARDEKTGWHWDGDFTHPHEKQPRWVPAEQETFQRVEPMEVEQDENYQRVDLGHTATTQPAVQLRRARPAAPLSPAFYEED